MPPIFVSVRLIITSDKNIDTNEKAVEPNIFHMKSFLDTLRSNYLASLIFIK